MEIIKLSTEWAKAEVFSSRFFIVSSILFLFSSIGFWQLGKTEMAKAYIVPTLVAGTLLLAVGVGIFVANKARVTSFTHAYETDASAFIESEIARTEKSMGEFRTIVFKVIPCIIAIAALCIVFFGHPTSRAICITTIAMMVVILLVDSNANARIENYHKQLKKVGSIALESTNAP